jgi:phospholipid transport system substrate-binding protein
MQLGVRCLSLLLGVVGLVGLAFSPAWAAAGPAHQVQRLIRAIGEMNAKTAQDVATDRLAHQAKAAREANDVLDIPAVGQWALGKHWRDRTPTEQREFIALLEELFVKVAYPKSASFFSDYRVDVLDERVNGTRATVRTTVFDPQEGLVAVDYRLIQHNGSWRVRDILLDDVSLAANLRSQFNQIIVKDSYAELLRRMREKLTE